jgi:hypothetical protein
MPVKVYDDLQNLNESIDSIAQLEREDWIEQQQLEWLVCHNILDSFITLKGAQ